MAARPTAIAILVPRFTDFVLESDVTYAVATGTRRRL